jgi:hypothetical protein
MSLDFVISSEINFSLSREKKSWDGKFVQFPSMVATMLSLCKFPEVVVMIEEIYQGNFIQPLRNWDLALQFQRGIIGILG